MKRTIILILIILFGFILRVYHLSTNPPGLYIDEVSIGYNAYKILTTGKDEYGTPFPMTFRSFGDYKMPVYIYATSIAMAVFGKNEFAIRFPSALAGTATIYLVYLLLTELMIGKNILIHDKWRKYIPLLGAFLLSFSRWHLQFSRGGFEVNLGVCLFIFAVYLSLLWYRKRYWLTLLFSAVLFSLSMYTYHIFRILTPITVIAGYAGFFLYLKSSRKQLALCLSSFVLLSIPIGLFSLTANGGARFAQTSTFTDYPQYTSVLQKVIYYPVIFLKNYLSFLSPEFLFNSGDGIGRHQLPGFGVIAYWQILFYFTGIITLMKAQSSRLKTVILFLFFLSPVAGAIARPSPQTLRDLLFVVPSVCLVALGIYRALNSKRVIVRSIAVFLFFLGSIEFSNYLHTYYGYYSMTNILDWGGEYKQVVLDTTILQKKYSHTYIDNNIGFISPYFKFYDEKARYTLVGNSWIKPANLNEKVLYIRPRYENVDTKKLIHTVYIPNANHDVFAQFFEE